MKIGVYVDGFNLYYGARAICGRGTPGWRWLDIRALSELLAKTYTNWIDPDFHVVYCSARVKGDKGSPNASGPLDQDTYFRALKAHNSIDLIELGHYVSRISYLPLAIPDGKKRPQLVQPDLPVLIKSPSFGEVADANFVVSVARREEKGSDVNVASHLLIDALTGTIDGAIVISNDSDLALPITRVREVVPIGIVNPTKVKVAGKLSCDPNYGVGGHWWHKLSESEIRSCQLPDVIGRLSKPNGW